MSPAERRRARRAAPALREAEARRREAAASSRSERRPAVPFVAVFAFSLGVVVMGILYSVPYVNSFLFFACIVEIGRAHV